MLTPGVLQASDRVWQAAFAQQMSHRSDAVKNGLVEIQKNLKTILGLSDEYAIVFFNSSGRGAVEAAVSAIVSSKKTLVLSNGRWASYLAHIAKTYNPDTVVAEFDQGKPLPLDRLEQILAEAKPEAVFFVAHETERGLLNPYNKIAELCKQHGCVIAVDAMSAVIAEDLTFLNSKADCVIFNSAKGLRALAGIGMVAVKHSLLPALDHSKNIYFDLKQEYELQTASVLPSNSLAPHAVMGLLEATRELLEEGVEFRRNEVRNKMEFLKNWAEAKKLAFVSSREYLGNFTLPLYLPDGWTYRTFNTAMQEKGYFVYYSFLGEEGNAFELSPVGAVSETDLKIFTQKAEEVLFPT
jgi:alanine-glyoxylate transaminase/serine-glyoxylate transaminase/serine-pyruvate transaminase